MADLLLWVSECESRQAEPASQARSRWPGNGGRNILFQPRQSLHQARIGAVFLDDPVAFRCRREIAAPDDARAAAEIFERDRLPELHRLDVFTTAVAVDDALRRYHLLVGDAVLIVAAVRAVHDEAPHAARTHIETQRRRREAVRAPPLRQMLGIGEHRIHKIARCIELPRPDHDARIAVEVQTTFCGHVSHSRLWVLSPWVPWLIVAWQIVPWPEASSGNRRDGRSSRRRSGDSVPASRRPPSGRAAQCGTAATALLGCA